MRMLRLHKSCQITFQRFYTLHSMLPSLLVSPSETDYTMSWVKTVTKEHYSLEKNIFINQGLFSEV